MPTPTPSSRLPALRDALTRYREGERASLAEMAKIYGVATNRFTTLVKKRFKNFPPARRELDKSHTYEALPAIRAMIAYVEEPAAERAKRAARVAAVMGSRPTSDDQDREDREPPLSAADLDRLANVRIKTFRLELAQGRYVLKSESAAQARRAHAAFMRAIMGIAQRIDPNGDLPPVTRQRLDRVTREIVSDVLKELSGPAGYQPDDEIEEALDLADERDAEPARGGARDRAGQRPRSARQRG